MGLYLASIANPAITAGLATQAILPMLRGGLYLSWVAGGAAASDFSLAYTQGLQHWYSMGVAGSPVPRHDRGRRRAGAADRDHPEAAHERERLGGADPDVDVPRDREVDRPQNIGATAPPTRCGSTCRPASTRPSPRTS
jgi:hypothetical protein